MRCPSGKNAAASALNSLRIGPTGKGSVPANVSPCVPNETSKVDESGAASKTSGFVKLDERRPVSPPATETCEMPNTPECHSLKYKRGPSLAMAPGTGFGSPSWVSWMTLSTCGAAVRVLHQTPSTVQTNPRAIAPTHPALTSDMRELSIWPTGDDAESGEDDTASRAKLRSCADWKRCSGAFSKQRRMMYSTAGGILSCNAANSAGSSFRTALCASADVAPRNARCPANIS